MSFSRTCFLLFAMCFFSLQTANAAALYIDPATSILHAGDTAKLAVRLDVASEECVNAADVTIVFPENLEVLDVSTGQSIFSIWVEPPVIHKDSNTVTLAGGIPNGYCGRVEGDPRLTNVVLDVIVRAPGLPEAAGTTTARVNLSDQSILYRNDGLGTSFTPDLYPATITLSNTPGTVLLDAWKEGIDADVVAPAPFSITLVKNDNDKYAIIFSTTDKQTGIDYYQVMEEPAEKSSAFNWGRADAPWITVAPPLTNFNYPLKDQTLNSSIYVKAVDKAGNETLAVLVPDQAVRTQSAGQKLEQFLLIGLVGLLSIIAAVVFFFFRRRKQAAVQTTSTSSATTSTDTQPPFTNP